MYEEEGRRSKHNNCNPYFFAFNARRTIPAVLLVQLRAFTLSYFVVDRLKVVQDTEINCSPTQSSIQNFRTIGSEEMTVATQSDREPRKDEEVMWITKRVQLHTRFR